MGKGITGMSQSGGTKLIMEIAIPVLGAVVSLFTIVFALCLCVAGGCCPVNCREKRRKSLLLRSCRKERYCSESKCCANETCPICLEDFKYRESIITSPCRHGFHKNCILGCLENSPACPVCKNTINDNRDSHERTVLLSVS